MDIISKEYGWSDKKILNLKFCRFRQIMTAITQRQYEASRAEDLRISWAVRNLATYIAGGYMTEGENKAVDIAQTISLDPVEQEFLEKAVPLMEMAPVEPKKGSTEKLLGLFSQTRS